MDIGGIVSDFADALAAVDALGPVGKSRKAEYRPGVGPLTEKEAVRRAVEVLPQSYSGIAPRRYPGSIAECDLVLPDQWALEFKIARPFGDNGAPAEHWIENVLYPFSGNQSLIGDCLKLQNSSFKERLGVLLIGFEHTPARLEVDTAVKCFEVIATSVLALRFSARATAARDGLIHPVHQQLKVFGWELLRS